MLQILRLECRGFRNVQIFPRYLLVLVQMVPLPLVQLALPMVPTFVRPVPVDITKMVTRVSDVDLLVLPEQEKQLLVRLHRIVFVHQIPVLVQMVQLPLVQLVLQMVPAFVRPVSVGITKLATRVLDVDLDVVLGQEKRLRVLQQLIVYVHRILALVRMVLKQPELLVLPIVPIFARLVIVVIVLVVHRVLLIHVLVQTEQQRYLTVLVQHFVIIQLLIAVNVIKGILFQLHLLLNHHKHVMLINVQLHKY